MCETMPEYIEKAVKEGYIEGIHRRQDKSKALEGFHEDFTMLVLNGCRIEKVDIDKWLARIDKMKGENPGLWQAETSYRFHLLDCTHNAAAVKVDVYKGDVQFSTDYMLLYRTGDEWKIVSKIFSVPQ